MKPIERAFNVLSLLLLVTFLLMFATVIESVIRDLFHVSGPSAIVSIFSLVLTLILAGIAFVCYLGREG
jgi:hypothetical protein